MIKYSNAVGMLRKFGPISAKSRGAILMKGLPYKSTGKEKFVFMY